MTTASRSAPNTLVVRLDVLVTDGTQPIAGLEARDFEVLDNGVPQNVELIAFENAPLNIVLALDMSRSVSGTKLVQLRSAAQMVIGSLAPRDKGALLSFVSTVFSRVPMTDDRIRLIDALGAAPTTGDTAVIDASYGAVLLSESDIGVIEHTLAEHDVEPPERREIDALQVALDEVDLLEAQQLPDEGRPVEIAAPSLDGDDPLDLGEGGQGKGVPAFQAAELQDGARVGKPLAEPGEPDVASGVVLAAVRPVSDDEPRDRRPAAREPTLQRIDRPKVR